MQLSKLSSKILFRKLVLISKNTRRLHFSKRLYQKPLVLSSEAFKAMKNSTKIPCKIASYVYNGFWQCACKYCLIMENKSFESLMFI
jgi:hypothetical protein